MGRAVIKTLKRGGTTYTIYRENNLRYSITEKKEEVKIFNSKNYDDVCDYFQMLSRKKKPKQLLSNEDKLKIKRDYLCEGNTLRILSIVYGVSISTIHNVVKEKI